MCLCVCVLSYNNMISFCFLRMEGTKVRRRCFQVTVFGGVHGEKNDNAFIVDSRTRALRISIASARKMNMALIHSLFASSFHHSSRSHRLNVVRVSERIQATETRASVRARSTTIHNISISCLTTPLVFFYLWFFTRAQGQNGQ